MVVSADSSSVQYFVDRSDAGRRLAQSIAQRGITGDLLILGLPRGGIPVAYEVARELKAPLDVWLVRKLGVPGHEELAMGALASGGAKIMNEDVVRSMGVRPESIDSVVAKEYKELKRREQEYRGDRPLPEIKGRVVIVVDDGLATGASMRAALRDLGSQDPARLIVAVPVGAPEVCRAMSREASEVICLLQPRFFNAVGKWYRKFTQTTDQEVRDLLSHAQTDAANPS